MTGVPLDQPRVVGSMSTASDTADKDSYRGGSMESDTLAVADCAVALGPLVERAEATLRDAVPPNTRRAYEGDLRRFAVWCRDLGLNAAPPVDPRTIVLHLRHLADREHGWSTVQRALAAICTMHTRAGYASPWGNPLVADMRTALRRELGVRPAPKRAADDEVLKRLLGVIPSGTLLGLRDRSLLTLGWAAAERRSEAVDTDVEDVRYVPKGLVLTVRSSKTDQEKRGAEIPVFYSNLPEHCPVRSLQAWLDAAEIRTGAIFRRLGRDERLGGRLAAPAVADRVKHWAKVAGFDPKDFAGHSLRRGFITTAARRGRDLDSIMVTTRHRSVAAVRGYIERETLHERGAGEGLL